ncbi:hypothetical protein [Campylobacter sp.]|uniref:hypothetical protein n=1 Tax=Campylobacter sp. TaxID=205 RepID=UPI002AA62F3D|nr:hypothetical protein [Campylobacter sp.]MCI6660990.1 hypothetical protein [Campylobacter sp.]MCI7022617.1 hypothetical protein [Campylobacter sp.]MCI7549558.1 hypothetical protein [Campylobacter sp.]
MKIDMQDQLQKLDDYFVGKNKTLYSLAAFVVILYFLAFVLAPLCESLKESFSSNLDKTRQELANTTSVETIKTGISNLEKALKQNVGKISELESQKKIYVNNAVKFAKAFFNSSELPAHINEVSNKAIESGVQITKIMNNTKEILPNKLDAMYDLNVSFNTKRFENALKYIYMLESTEEISDISYFDIKGQNGYLNCDLNIITWGFKND